jgi:hypothetical protein
MQGNPVPVKDGFEMIIKAFENTSYMGVLRQRWVEIKKLDGYWIQLPQYGF